MPRKPQTSQQTVDEQLDAAAALLEKANARIAELERSENDIRYWKDRANILEPVVAAFIGQNPKKRNPDLRKQITDFLMTAAVTEASPALQRVVEELASPQEEEGAEGENDTQAGLRKMIREEIAKALGG